MNTNASASSKGNPHQTRPQKGYRVWHLSVAVPAIAVTLQLMLGSLTPLPAEQPPYPARYASIHDNPYNNYRDYLHQYHRTNELPDIEILPLNLRGEMTGPILASVLKEYFPHSTTEQANDLRDTLPPCDNPRMIVIVPKQDDKPVF